jgi:hypothetical protein
VGVWDVPINGDFSALDGLFGGVQTVGASSVPILLTSPAGFVPTPGGGPTQAQNAVLRFTGALTSAVQVTLPLPGYNIIENLTTGAFILQFRAIAAGQVICVDQGEIQHIYNDGTNVRFVNLGRIGSYLDICDATVPAWIANCTIPPYLDCNGSTFSAVTYPYLNAKLGGNTLPDFRGRGAFYLNEGTGRLTSGGAGIDGNTRFAAGGNNGLTASLLPTITVNGVVTVNVGGGQSVPTNTGIGNVIVNGGSATIAPASANAWSSTSSFSGSNTLTSNNTSGNATGPNAAPGVVSGLRLIRAA